MLIVMVANKDDPASVPLREHVLVPKPKSKNATTKLVPNGDTGLHGPNVPKPVAVEVHQEPENVASKENVRDQPPKPENATKPLVQLGRSGLHGHHAL